MMLNTTRVLLLLGLAIFSLQSFAQTLEVLSEAYADEQNYDLSRESRPGAIHGLLGGGLLNLDKPVGEDKRITVAVPLVMLRYKDTAYWSLGGGGLWVLKSEDRRARLGLALKIRRGYNTDDDDVLRGMEERRNTVDGGIVIRYASAINIRAAYYADMADRHGGESATVTFTKPLRAARRLWLTPVVGAEWQSQEFVDYYYGVRATEATVFRPAYTGESGVSYRFGITATYPVNSSLALMGGAFHVRLHDGISDSPIVTDDSISMIFLGAGWVF